MPETFNKVLRFLVAIGCLGWTAIIVIGMLLIIQEEPVTWVTWLLFVPMFITAVLALFVAESILPEEWKPFKAADTLKRTP